MPSKRSTEPSLPVANIAAYRFAALANLKPLRERLLVACRDWGLKGTILLSEEGVNLFVAGSEGPIGELISMLRGVPGLEELEPKFSRSDGQPFSRMLVKIKREIIAFGVEGIDPVRRPAPRLAPRQLKEWLDEGRPVLLLDTRNNFEVDVGTFRNAVPIGIRRFREFPQAADQLSVADDRPIVTFCTGGIRCEKAAPYLIERGFKNVFQLDGGILKYFEECGSDHYEGDCFVFDKRVGLAADLEESGRGFCYVCQTVLTAQELADPLTVEGKSCPHCYRSPRERREIEIAEHREKLRLATNPLPGKTPLDNYRPLKVHARHDGLSLIDFLRGILRHIPPQEWPLHFEAGDVVDAERRPVDAARKVRAGERYYTLERFQVEPDVNPAIEILDEDDALMVIHKPAPLPTHPSGRYHRNTLEWILRQVFAPQKPRPAHRLDANTSGVMVFTRKASFARLVQPQFERGEVDKRYLALVAGNPPHDRFHCDASISAVSQRYVARLIDEAEGLPSRTEFQVVERFADGTTLLEATPKTGRTNQIRVHLWHLGFPIIGDPTYLPDGRLGDAQTVRVDDAPLCLHAWRLTFVHPQTLRPVAYEASPPTWARRRFHSDSRLHVHRQER